MAKRKEKEKVVAVARDTNLVFELETGIPIPPIQRRGKYPFAEMEVEDSFFVSEEVGTKPTIASAAYNHGRKAGKKFCVRIVDGGSRVWRVE